MTPNDAKYNEIMIFLGERKNIKSIEPKDFNIESKDFKNIISEMEKDGNIEKGYWFIDNPCYAFRGLTYKGTSFLQNNDKKQYSKIEKTEVTCNNNVNINGNNYGNAMSGNSNTIQSPLDQKIIELIDTISKSQLSDKEQIIEELQHSKKDKVGIQQTLGKLLTRGAEVSSLVSMITGILTL